MAARWSASRRSARPWQAWPRRSARAAPSPARPRSWAASSCAWRWAAPRSSRARATGASPTRPGRATRSSPASSAGYLATAQAVGNVVGELEPELGQPAAAPSRPASPPPSSPAPWRPPTSSPATPPRSSARSRPAARAWCAARATSSTTFATTAACRRRSTRGPFKVGENLAPRPVRSSTATRSASHPVQPSTAEVRKRPVLMIPPQINRYYFMDLAPGRSFVEHAVSRGLQFFTSAGATRPPRSRLEPRHLRRGVLARGRRVTEITGSDELNVLGLCAGGITPSTMLSHLAASGDDRVHAASFGVTLLDFAEPAPIGMFLSPRLLGFGTPLAAQGGARPAGAGRRLRLDAARTTWSGTTGSTTT